MSELDDILLKLSQDREKNPSNKSRIELTDDLVIKKVAFDMVKVFGDQYNDLWKVEKEGDVGAAWWLWDKNEKLKF